MRRIGFSDSLISLRQHLFGRDDDAADLEPVRGLDDDVVADVELVLGGVEVVDLAGFLESDADGYALLFGHRTPCRAFSAASSFVLAAAPNARASIWRRSAQALTCVRLHFLR